MLHLIDYMERGEFNSLGKPDRVIDTLISKLFFFGDDVYKVYKYNKAFFGDFSDDRFRHEFYHDDFTWNTTMSPGIYLKLGYVRKNGDVIEDTTHDLSEDYYILMKKIDDSQTLFNLLEDKKIGVDDLEVITEEMFKRTEKLTEIKRNDMQDLFAIPYIDLDIRYMETLQDWLSMAPGLISKENADATVAELKSFINSYPYFKEFNTGDYLTSIDNHSGNILYQHGQVNFIDSMPPMRIWRIQTDAYSISRPATDVEVILGKEYADAMYARFEIIRQTKVDPKLRAYLQAVAALIQASYMHMLKKDVLAKKFWDFAQEKIRGLKA